MGVSEILVTLDREIALLQKAKALLNGDAAPAAKKKVGRPKRATVVAPVATKPAKKKRKLSPEGRKRIAEAVKKRWAAQKAMAAK
jgi:mono/diheme cytochrome c family protein